MQVQSGARYAIAACNHGRGLSAVELAASQRDLFGGEFRRPTQTNPARLCGRQTGRSSLSQNGALEFGEGTDHVQQRNAGRSARVNALGDGEEGDATTFELLEHVQKIEEAASQPVEFPDDEGIASLQSIEAPS